MIKIVLVAYNVRSAHNVGSMLRTADGLGIDRVYLCGYTPYPSSRGDRRLPYLAAKTSRQIQKTALGAENNINWVHRQNIRELLSELKNQDYVVVALEQTKDATDLRKFKPALNVALVVGNEVDGLPRIVLDICDKHVCIPMFGKKESFNVSVVAAIALYHLKYLA